MDPLYDANKAKCDFFFQINCNIDICDSSPVCFVGAKSVMVCAAESVYTNLSELTNNNL